MKNIKKKNNFNKVSDYDFLTGDDEENIHEIANLSKQERQKYKDYEGKVYRNENLYNYYLYKNDIDKYVNNNEPLLWNDELDDLKKAIKYK